MASDTVAPKVQPKENNSEPIKLQKDKMLKFIQENIGNAKLNKSKRRFLAFLVKVKNSKRFEKICVTMKGDYNKLISDETSPRALLGVRDFAQSLTIAV